MNSSSALKLHVTWFLVHLQIATSTAIPAANFSRRKAEAEHLTIEYTYEIYSQTHCKIDAP